MNVTITFAEPRTFEAPAVELGGTQSEGRSWQWPGHTVDFSGDVLNGEEPSLFVVNEVTGVAVLDLRADEWMRFEVRSDQDLEAI